MKFIHIADVHLGATPDSEYSWGCTRKKEIKKSFCDLIDICTREKIDLLLIAGDLFHRQPLLRELKELNYQFERMKDTKVVLIAGNHDYVGPRSHYVDFEWAKNVTMLKDEVMQKVVLEELNTEVYGFSYHKRNIPEPLLNNVRPENNERMHILLAHGGDEKNIPIDRNQVKELPFDYIALGHIHKPAIINQHCANVGSFEPLDKNELGARGYILGELTKDSCQIQFVAHSLRRYEWLNVDVTPKTTQGEICTMISERIKQRGEDNIYRVHLLGYNDVDLQIDEEQIKELGNIIEITNDTVPDYDFERLKMENQDNIIGLYIDKVHESDTNEEIKTKALYYGLEALLNAKNRCG